MSRLTELFHTILDHVAPPRQPQLSAPVFFESTQGAWARHDSASNTLWGYAGIRLGINEAANQELIKLMLSEMTRLHAQSVHVGLLSYPLAPAAIDTWEQAQSASECQAVTDLRQVRAQWLSRLGMRERVGYALVRVKLDATDFEGQAERLSFFIGALRSCAHTARAYSVPLCREDILRIVEFSDNDTTSYADLVLSDEGRLEKGWPEAPAVRAELENADSSSRGTYHATLSMEPRFGRKPARAQARLRVPRNNVRAEQLFRKHFYMAGITSRDTPTGNLHFPVARAVSRWTESMPDKLYTMAPLTSRLPGQCLSQGGMPLRSLAGEFCNFAPFSDHHSANTLLLGDERAPTLTVAGELVLAHLAAGQTAFIIDDTGEFAPLTEALNGERVVIGTEGPQGLDMTRSMAPDQDIGEVASWLIALAGVPATDALRFFAGQTLYDLSRLMGGQEITLAMVQRMFSGMDNHYAELLAAGLAPFVGKGAYAGLFAGEPREYGHSKLTVVDVSAWKGKSVLPHIVAAVMQLASRRYRLRKDQPHVQKLFVLNQTAAFDMYGVAQQQHWLEEWLRRARRLNMGALLTAEPNAVAPGGALFELADSFPNWLVLSLTSGATRVLRSQLGFTSRHTWELGCIPFYGTMQPAIRMLVFTNNVPAVYEFRPDPDSVNLFARCRETARRAISARGAEGQRNSQAEQMTATEAS
ncbi:hypothetical protein WL29_22875 [Burkholderia ubonensis]|uniref:Uncharacterized protein n=1 Tax=Burkholderia ubonensis TaxID=101571 RepID=A0A119HFN6_9BURK|nr:hypothetical protein [Burkholderia ubonensis]KWA84207.1 hypothetical protein WL29_22875 [Burkholderia ubonensis]